MTAIRLPRARRHEPSLHTRLEWSGDLDMATAPGLGLVLGALTKALGSTGRLDLDLAQVTFMDCAGLAPLLQTHNHLGVRLRLVSASVPVQRLLRLAEVVERFAARVDHPNDEASITSGETVERAKGLVMATYHCGATEAFQRLVATSAAHNMPVGVLAATLTQSVSTVGVSDVAGAVRQVMELGDPLPGVPEPAA